MSVFAAVVGWVVVAIMFVAQLRMAAELDRLRRYRNAAEGRGYYTRAEVDEAWERLRDVVFDPEISASGIETEGQDGATRLGAEHESPTAATSGGDAEPIVGRTT